jgi:hypothetical protein
MMAQEEKEIRKHYKKWTAGEKDNPFKRESSWVGDMVLGFTTYSNKQTRLATIEEIKPLLCQRPTRCKIYLCPNCKTLDQLKRGEE